MKMKSLYLTLFFIAFLLQFNFAQNIKNAGNDSSLSLGERIEQLKIDPIANYRTAYWFSQLPFENKMEYSKRLGTIVLIVNDSSDFVVAFGADKSPYPWAFNISKDKIDLHANNKFIYIFRKDKYAINQYGVYWTWDKYETKIKTNSPIFIKELNPRSQNGDLWIPATEWQYVGSKLEMSKDTLNADKNIVNKLID